MAGAVPVDPASNAATDARANVDSSSAAGQGHGLSKGTIAGIVLGSIAAAALLTTLIAFIVIKVTCQSLRPLLSVSFVSLAAFAPHSRSVPDVMVPNNVEQLTS